MRITLTHIFGMLSLSFHVDITSALPLYINNNKEIVDIHLQRSFDGESIKFERRGIMNKLKSAGNAAADVFRTKAQKKSNAMKDVLDPHKEVTPKTLSRLDTIHIASLGPEYAKNMKVKDAVKVGKVVSDKINKHADIRDKAMKNMGSPEYEIAHYTGASKSQKEALIHEQHGFHQTKYAQRPETKKLLHNQVRGAQEKIDSMMPLYNTFSSRVASGDAARGDRAHPDNTKQKIVTKGWDHVVNAGVRVNKLQTEKMLRHQKNANDVMREKIKTDRHLDVKNLPSTFDNHPNRPTVIAGSQHSPSNGQHTIHGNPGSSHSSHSSEPRSPAVQHISDRQHFRAPDKPKTLSFEGHESRWTKQGKPAPQYFLGSKFIKEVDAVKNHESPLAKQTHMHEYVQPKEIHPSNHPQGSSHSASHHSPTFQSPKSGSGSGSGVSERHLLGREPTFSSHHADPGPSTSSHQHRSTPQPRRTEIDSGSSSSGSNKSASSPNSRRVSLADLLKIPQ